MTEVLEKPTEEQSENQTEAVQSVYKWSPRWQYLDDDDLIHWFCSLDIKINKKQYENRDLHPRLKRLFTKKGRKYEFKGTIDSLEIDDVTQLTAFLTIKVSQQTVEQSTMPMRLTMHFEWDEEKQVYDYQPVTRYLDFYDVPMIISYYDQELSEEEFNRLPARMKTFYKKVSSE